jgi:hypothetical protein
VRKPEASGVSKPRKTAYERITEAIEGKRLRVLHNPSKTHADAQCPAHENNNRSLSITAPPGNGR